MASPRLFWSLSTTASERKYAFLAMGADHRPAEHPKRSKVRRDLQAVKVSKNFILEFTGTSIVESLYH